MKRKNRVAILNILSTLLLYGISVISAPIFSSLLGTNGYGILSDYNIWVSITAIVATLQTQGTLVNARVEFPESEQRRYQSAVMSLSLVCFLAVTTVAMVFSGPITALLHMNKLLLGLILLQSFGTFCVNFLNAKFTYEMKAGRNLLVAVGVAVSTLALSIVLVLLMPEETNYYGRILGNATVYGLLGVVICIAVLAKGKTFYHRDYWKFCLVLALPVVLYNLSDLLLGNSDLVMLRRMRGDSAAGIYGLAYKFGGIMFTIFCALNNSWVPFFFEDMKQGKVEAVRAQAANFLELFTVLSMGFVLLSREVFHIFARPSFWDGTVLAPIFVASYYLNFLCTFPVNFEYFHKKIRVVAAATIGSSLVNIALNYVLITKLGMLGAALATMLSHSLQLSAHLVYTRLCGKPYPFRVRLWAPYALCFVGAMALTYAGATLWVLRWGLGALLGIWELLRIRKRKVLL